MKKLKELGTLAVVLLSVIIFTGCNTYRQGTYGLQTSYENPQWAPPYYNGARYYYLPDIECYYDVYTREFIFLNNARWIYSPYIPSIYPDFNLNNCFVVVVKSNIYQPWMHHQYYISHFPRYYYRNYYDHSNIPYVRGYNENNRSAIYWKENERDRARSWDDENLRNNRQFRYSREDRLQQNNPNNQAAYRHSPGSSNGSENTRNTPENIINQAGNSGNNPVYQQPQNDNNKATQPAATSETRRPQNTNYYGKPIGQPVKVNRQMRIQNTIETKDKRSNSPGNQRSRSGNTNDQNKQGRR